MAWRTNELWKMLEAWETLDTKERRNLDMLTGTTRSTRSLLLMLFGISCHAAASSIPGSLAVQGGEPTTQARRAITTRGKEHLTRRLDVALTRPATGPAVAH